MKTPNDNIVAVKSKDFAVRCVNLYKYLCSDKREFVLSKQLLKSGTSIGANIWESMRAESTADFVHKLRISLKEASETSFWITVLYESEYLTEKEADSIMDDCNELSKLLTSIINSNENKVGSVN